MKAARVVLVALIVLLALRAEARLATDAELDARPAVSEDFLDEHDPRRSPLNEDLVPNRQEVEDSYADGFTEACSDVYSNGDGALYYRGVEYTENDCLTQGDSSNADFLDDPDDAYYQGLSDGYDAAFLESDVLCYGVDCWTRGDF